MPAPASPPSAVQPSALLAPTLAAVAQAAELVRQAWDAPSTVRRKGRIDLVTETDLAVEAALKASLSQVCPQAAFLAEESAAALSDRDRQAALSAQSGPCWVIDPLDGTTNFAHRLPFVGIAVGLWTGSSVDLGVVSNPILGETFWAVRGEGAWRNGKRLAVSAADQLEDCLVATGFPYTADRDGPRLAAWLTAMLARTRGVRRYGAASLDLAYVAAGHYECFYEIGLKPWDVAAGWLLVEEAGGRVSGYLDDEAFHLDAPSILASNGKIHEAALDILRKA